MVGNINKAGQMETQLPGIIHSEEKNQEECYKGNAIFRQARMLVELYARHPSRSEKHYSINR